MTEQSFVFVGNRRFVLQEMQAHKLQIQAAFVIANSHLHRSILSGEVPTPANCHIIERRSELMEALSKLKFDVFVANGCPFILPIQDLPSATYVNIHPSYLPDLRGIDPVIGSILHSRDAGATCHIMDRGVDTGPIISQVRIPWTDDLDVTTLYQLSFIAERKAFTQSLARDFKPQYEQVNNPEAIYYSRKPEDRIITFGESNALLLRKIKAFNNRSIGCEFVASGRKFRVFQAMRMSNPFLSSVAFEAKAGTVVLSYENSIIFHKDGEVLRFLDVMAAEGGQLNVGDVLFEA